MKREQFTFYRSFWTAFKALPKKDQLPFISSVCAYALDEEEPPEMTGGAAVAFALVRPILDKASKRAAVGQKGGSKTEAKRKQTQSK